MRQRKWFRWAAGMVALATTASFAAACSGGNGSNTNSSTGGTKVAGGTAVYAEVAGFVPNFILPFVDGGHFGTWNMNDFQSLMYRPLYWMGQGTNPSVTDTTKDLAQSTTWSNGGKSVTVTLKPYKWSNGESVDGADVEFYVNLYKAEETENGGYVPPLTAGGTTLKFFPDNVTSMSVSGQSITFNLNQAYSQTWYEFNELAQITPLPQAWDVTGPGQTSNCATTVADCAAVYKYLSAQNKDLSTYASNPLWQVVDGPWHLASFNSDGHLTMKPNTDYSGPDKPTLAAFEEVPFTDSAAEYNQLRAGTKASNAVDFGYLPNEDITSPTTSPTKAGSNPLANQGYTLDPLIGYTINYFPLNMNNPTVGPIFKQLYARQAIQETVDQESAITNLDKGYGYLTTGPQPFEPTSSLVSPEEQTNPYPFSTSKAKALLTANGWNTSTSPATCAKAGTATGDCGAGVKAGQAFSFTVDYASGSPTLTTLMQALQTDAAEAGIKISIVAQAGSAITQESQPCTATEASCSWEAGNWGAGWVYAPDYLPTGEDLYATGSVANYGSFSDSTIDGLIIKSIETSGNASYYAAEDAISQAVPVVWQPDADSQLVEVASNLHGFDNNVFLNIDPEDWYFTK
jgi:peptide/nickel transport system substrate-binding protein